MKADATRGDQAKARRDLGSISPMFVHVLCGWKHALLTRFHRHKLSSYDRQELLFCLLIWNANQSPIVICYR